MTTTECIIYDEIVELGIATPDEINLVRCIMDGSWIDVFDSIIYARTGYRSIVQFLQAEEEEE